MCRLNKELMDVLLRHSANINARLAEIMKGNNKATVGPTALCFAVWFVTNLAKGVHGDEEIKSALDILEVLLDYGADVDGVSGQIRRFLLKQALVFKGRGETLLGKAWDSSSRGSDSHIRYIDALKDFGRIRMQYKQNLGSEEKQILLVSRQPKSCQ
jgi:hypothetical protein